MASLSATFLALGIGILIGTAFVGAKVVDRQTMMMNRLNTNLAEVRKDTRERELTEQTLQVSVPRLVQETLAGEQVLVLQIGNSTAAVDQVNKALALTGAQVISVTLNSAAWLKLEESERERKAKDLGEQLALGQPGTLMRLQTAGLLSGVPEMGLLPTRLVLAGGESEELARTRDIPLLKALKSGEAHAVVVELYAADPSLIPLWGGEAEATVDCIDRALGWLALPLALQGTAGSFGMKSGAISPDVEKLTRPTPLPTPTPEP